MKKMSEIIKENESYTQRYVRKSKIPNEDNIKSKVIIRFNEVQLTSSLITELQQKIQFKGKQFSMLEYYFLKKGKRIWITQDWDSDGDGYLYCEFYCDSHMSTEEIKDLTCYNQYFEIDNLFGGMLLHVYYQNTNNKKGYFQMYDGNIEVGYSIDDFQSQYRKKLKEDIEHIINLSDTHDSDKPFQYNQSVKQHTITFKEVDDEYHLSGNVQNNRNMYGYMDRDTGWKLRDINLDTVNFNKSKNEYVFWVNKLHFKKTLLRDSFNYIKMYLPSQIESDYPKPSNI